MRPALLSFVFALLAGCNLTSNQVSVLDDSGDIAPDKLTAVLASYEARLDALELENAALRTDLETALAAKADQEDLDVLDGRVGDLEADAATATTDIGDLQARMGSVETAAAANTADIVAHTADIATNASAIAALDGDLAALDAATVQRIESPTTIIDVPGTFDGVTLTWLEDALNLLDGYAIDRDATVTIQLGTAYAETRSTPIEVAHPDGARIEILGDFDATTTEFVLDGGSDGFVVTDGAALGLLDGVDLQGLDTSAGSGVRAFRGASIALGPSVTISGFWRGVASVGGSALTAPGITVSGTGGPGFNATTHSYGGFWESEVTNAGGAGYEAETGSTILAADSDAMQCTGDGYIASTGSYMSVSGADAIDNDLAGIKALYGSTIRGVGVTSEGNDGSGYRAANGAFISLDGSSATNNGSYGAYASQGAGIDIGATFTNTGNTNVTYPPTVTDDAWILQ